jgi:hypothetical protein
MFGTNDYFLRWLPVIDLGATQMKFKVLTAATIATTALVYSAVNASAAIVCSGNVCWHVTERYDYPPSAGIVIHEDTCRAGPGIAFREHEGRGYWKDDTWTDW